MIRLIEGFIIGVLVSVVGWDTVREGMLWVTNLVKECVK